MSIGTRGKHPQNNQRDMFRMHRKSLRYKLRLFYIDTTVRNSLGRCIPQRRAMMLPHDFMVFLWHQDQAVFHSLFGTSHLKDFWAKLMHN